MATAPINNSNTSKLNTPSATKASSGSGFDKAAGSLSGGDFMKLLIAQLKNQDPLNPQDPTQMMSQLSELTGVEKLTSIDQNMTKLLTANSIPTSSYLGAYVGLSSDSGHITAGDGGIIKFDLPQDASKVVVNLLSADGKTVVDSIDLGSANKGEAFAAIKTSKAPDGDYKIEVQATGTSGRQFKPTFSIGGIVTSIHTGANPTLLVNGQEVKPDQVTEIATPPQTSSAPSA